MACLCHVGLHPPRGLEDSNQAQYVQAAGICMQRAYTWLAHAKMCRSGLLIAWLSHALPHIRHGAQAKEDAFGKRGILQGREWNQHSHSCLRRSRNNTTLSLGSSCLRDCGRRDIRKGINEMRPAIREMRLCDAFCDRPCPQKESVFLAHTVASVNGKCLYIAPSIFSLL